MSDFLQLLIAGATTGSIYGLIGLIFTLTYNATKLPNLALGEFVMIGAMLAVLTFSVWKLPMVVAFPFIILAGGACGIVFDRLVTAPMRKAGTPMTSQIMATIAAAIVISGGMAQIAGVRQLGLPAQFQGGVIRMGELSILPQNLAVIVITALIGVGLWLFLSRTRFGLSIVATGYNPTAARLVGIKVSHVFLATFALSAAIAALAGAIVAPIISASAYMGLNIAIKGFIAAVVGGMGRPIFALVGGLVVGICETMMSGYVSSSFNEVITLGLMLAVLMARPTGLLGERT